MKLGLMTFSKPAAVRFASIALILFALITAAYGRHQKLTTQPAADPPPQLARDMLEGSVASVKFEGVPFVDAIDWILNPVFEGGDDSHRNIFVDLAVLKGLKIDPATPIKYKAENRRIGDVFVDLIKLVGAEGKLAVFPEEDVLVLTTPERAAQIAEEHKATDAAKWDSKTLAQRDVRLPEISFHDRGLNAAVAWVDETDVFTVDVDWEAFKSAGVDRFAAVDLHLTKVTRIEALRFIFLAVYDKPVQFVPVAGGVRIVPATQPADPAKRK